MIPPLGKGRLGGVESGKPQKTLKGFSNFSGSQRLPPLHPSLPRRGTQGRSHIIFTHANSGRTKKIIKIIDKLPSS